MGVVVIGSGIAAVAAVQAMRANRYEGEVTLVTNDEPPFYYRPMLPSLIDGSKTMEEILLTVDPVADFGAELVKGTVQGVNCAAKTVILSSGDVLGYEKLLVASGSSPSFPQIKGLDAEGVFTLRTMKDALGLCSYLQRTDVSKAVVIGAGLVGVRTAEALRRRGLAVTLVERLPTILYPVVDQVGAAIVASRLQKAGLEVIVGARAEQVLCSDGKVAGLRLASGEIPAEVVVVATGVRPNVGFLEGSGVDCRRGILVNPYLQTSQPDIYAAGDVVEYLGLLEDEPIVSPLWTTAVATGKVAGTNIAGGKMLCEEFLPVMSAAEIGGLPVIAAGLVAMEGNGYEVFERREGENYRKLVFKGDTLAGVLFVGEVEGAGVYVSLLKAQKRVGGLKRQIAARRLTYAQLVGSSGDD